MGFIQDVIAFTHKGHYVGNEIATSNLESLQFPRTDVINKTQYKGSQKYSTAWPWYAIDKQARLYNLTGNVTRDITSSDTPHDGTPVWWNNARLTTIDLTYKFLLTVSAQTVDTRGGADRVFTIRAAANWEFVGDSNIVGGKWVPSNAAKKVHAPKTWTVGVGACPVLTDKCFNDDLSEEAFN